MLNWLFLVWLPRKLNQNKKKKNSLFVLSLFRNVKLNYCAMLNWFIGAEQKNGGQRGHKFSFCFPGVSQQPNKWNLNSQAQTLQENIANWHLQVDYSPKLVEYPYAWEILASINKSSVSSKINPKPKQNTTKQNGVVFMTREWVRAKPYRCRVGLFMVKRKGFAVLVTLLNHKI